MCHLPSVHPFFFDLRDLILRGFRLKAIRLPRERFEREIGPVVPGVRVEFWGNIVTLVDEKRPN